MTGEPDEEQDGIETPTVSIIIPTDRRSEILSEAIQSVRSQTYTDWEAIVVVPAERVPKIRSFVESFDDDRFRVTPDEGIGVSQARNVGIEAARGDFIAFLDSDDRWKPAKLESQIDRFTSGSDSLGLVYTGFVHQELDGNRWVRRPKQCGDIYTKQLEKDWINPPSTVIVKTEVFEEVGGFNTGLPTREDYELWLRVTEQYEVGCVDEFLVEKREQTDSLSKDFSKRIEGDLAVFEIVKERMAHEDLNFLSRSRILSTHHLVIGRDYESNNNRKKAVYHLLISILRYPLQAEAWLMLFVAVFGIDRNGRFLTFIKKLVWS